MKLAAAPTLNQEGLPIKSQFKHRNEIQCFLYVLEKKIGPATTALLLYVNVLERMVLLATKSLSEADLRNNKRDESSECLRLISLVALLNENLNVTFNDLCKKDPSAELMLAYNKLTVASSFYFFAAYLKSKLQTGHHFKKSSQFINSHTVQTVEAFG